MAMMSAELFAPSASVTDGARREVLLVDHDPVIRLVCRIILERRNFRPILAESGVEGLYEYQEKCADIAVVIADILDGISIAQEIFRINPHANVIITTVYDPPHAMPDELRRRCAVVSKSFAADDLLAAIAHCVQQPA